MSVVNKVHIQVWIPLLLAPYIVTHNHPYISSCSRYLSKSGLQLGMGMCDIVEWVTANTVCIISMCLRNLSTLVWPYLDESKAFIFVFHKWKAWMKGFPWYNIVAAASWCGFKISTGLNDKLNSCQNKHTTACTLLVCWARPSYAAAIMWFPAHVGRGGI